MSADEETEDIGVEGDESFKVEQQWEVSYMDADGKKKQWHCETVDKCGLTFVRLQKFDAGFVGFALRRRRSTTRRSGQGQAHGGVPMWEKLLELRRVASEEAACNALEMPSDGGQGGKRKKRKVREEDQQLVDPYITIDLPSFEHGGLTHGARPMEMLWGLSSRDIWCPLNEANLCYMKALVQHGQAELTTRPRKSPKKLRRMKEQIRPE